jgi:hypothetical protein
VRRRCRVVLSTAYLTLYFLPSPASIKTTGRCNMSVPQLRIFPCTEPHITSTFLIVPFAVATQSTVREKEGLQTGFFTMCYFDALIAARPAISGSTALVSAGITAKNSTNATSDSIRS